MQANVIAVIFDYDDTLVPDSTTYLLRKKKIDVKKFWERDFKKLVSQHYDPPHAYLKLILDNVGNGKKLQGLSNNELRKIGKEVETTLYPGFKSLISDLKKTVADYDRQNGIAVKIEFFVISGGLEEVIKGNKFICDNFSGIYGCRLGNDANDNSKPLTTIKRTITFTEKTKFIFEINKGISQSDSDADPSAVNAEVEEKERTVLFKNMIYVGDGLTDIPCFSLLGKNGGSCFAVKHMNRSLSERLKIYREIIKTKRTYNQAPPNYRKDQLLGDNLRLAVMSLCQDIVLAKHKAK